MDKLDTNLRIVNVMDPIMCLRCQNAHIAEVLFTNGTTKKMFYCARLDCDNWYAVQDECRGDVEEKKKAA